MERVNAYLYEVLKPQLQDYKVSAEFANEILANIEIQIVSALRHWNDHPFRKALLIIGLDQGAFYRPDADIEVKCFVATAIRNSMLETIQSEACQRAGLDEALESEHVKIITGAAISYFKEVDFMELAKQAEVSDAEDYYGTVSGSYPVAWTALKQLGLCKGKSATYKKVACLFPLTLPEINSKEISAEHMKTVIMDGYSGKFDDSLRGYLNKIDANIIKIFAVDNFKFVSRNFEKLLKVMEFILSRGAVFSTSNFYLENGYVEKRKTILRAAHSLEEWKFNANNFSGIGPRHATVLKAVAESMK